MNTQQPKQEIIDAFLTPIQKLIDEKEYGLAAESILLLIREFDYDTFIHKFVNDNLEKYHRAEKFGESIIVENEAIDFVKELAQEIHRSRRLDKALFQSTRKAQIDELSVVVLEFFRGKMFLVTSPPKLRSFISFIVSTIEGLTIEEKESALSEFFDEIEGKQTPSHRRRSQLFSDQTP